MVIALAASEAGAFIYKVAPCAAVKCPFIHHPALERNEREKEKRDRRCQARAVLKSLLKPKQLMATAKV